MNAITFCIRRGRPVPLPSDERRRFVCSDFLTRQRLWAMVKRAIERDPKLRTTHPVLAKVWRDHAHDVTKLDSRFESY